MKLVKYFNHLLLVSIFFIICSSFSFAEDSSDSERSLNDGYRDPITGLPSPERDKNPEYKYNKLDAVKESLTTSYINSMRAGKWGASDPGWVNLDLAKTFFPDAAMIGFLEGDIPTVAVMSGEDLNTGEDLLGYMFMTRDITISRGFSSQIFDIVVGLGLDGKLAGATVIDHLEPIIGIYTEEGELVLPRFTKQYKGIDIRVPTRVSLLKKTEGAGTIDGISAATVSAVLFNGAILRAARVVALSKGLRLNDEPMIDIVNFYPTDFKDLIENGSVSRLTLTLEGLSELGMNDPKITNRSGVNDIYRYKALFAGNTPVAAKQKEVKRGYTDTPRNLVIDLFVAPVETPTIGRNLLGNQWYDIFVAGRDTKEITIVLAALGRYPIDGEPNMASGPFKRLAILQGEKRFQLSKDHYRNLNFLKGEDKPFFADAGLFRIPAETGIDPVKPWKLELLVESNIEGEDKKFYIDYELDSKYIIQPDGLDVIANTNDPIWHAAWQSQKLNLGILFTTLLILSLAMWKVDILVQYKNYWKAFRYLFLAWVLIWLGWYVGGQVTILSILTWLTAPLLKPSWDVLLSDPILVSLMAFVLVSFVIWGRGVFCGWLCPFGSMQELLAKFAKFIRIPQLKLSHAWHVRLWPIKYFLLLGLVAIGFYSMADANVASEIEPFKTAISMKFNREWYFVLYAILLLGVGLVVERFFCRFLCPLGAFMAIGGKLRIFSILKRRKECGSPCQLCSHDCPINAIEPSGKIKMDECFYCLDCQSLYYDQHKCPPLVQERKKRKRSFEPQLKPKFAE